MDSKNWIRSYVIQIIPVISLVIYILGFSYYLAYYSVLGINIISYITLSEVLVSSLVLIVVCSIIVFLCYSIVQIYIPWVLRETGKVLSTRLFKTIASLWCRLWSKILPKRVLDTIISLWHRLLSNGRYDSLRKRLNGYLGSIGISNLVLILLICTTNLGRVSHRLFLLGLMAAYIYNICEIYRFYSFLPVYRVRNFYYTVTSGIIIIGLMTSLIVLGIKDGERIATEEPSFFELYLSNEQKLDSKQYSYIGDTSTAIFLYDREKTRSLIINRDHVLFLTLNREEMVDRYSPPDSIKTKILDEGVIGIFKLIEPEIH